MFDIQNLNRISLSRNAIFISQAVFHGSGTIERSQGLKP
jgi:hypothetical protein